MACASSSQALSFPPFIPPPQFPVVITDKPHGLFTLVVWFFCIPPTTWAPCAAVDDKQSHEPVVDVKESTTHAAIFWLSFPNRLPLSYFYACTSASHFLVVCSPSVLFLPPPINNNICTPQVSYQRLFALHHLYTQPHFTQPVACAVYQTPRQHPSFSQATMSLSKTLAPVISPTLHDRPRTNLVPWKVAINRAARAVFAEWDDFGFLFGVCDDAVWAVLNTPAGGALRDRPEFPAPDRKSTRLNSSH